MRWPSRHSDAPASPRCRPFPLLPAILQPCPALSFGPEYACQGRLGYTYRRFNGSLGGDFTAERPDGVYGRFREAVAQFDTSHNWKLTRRTTLYVQGRDITGQPLKWFDTPPGVAERRQRVLRQYQEYGAN